MNTPTRTITVPENVWGRLASEADNRGISIADLLVVTIQKIVRPPTNRSTRVIELARAGFTDRDICEMTGETRNYVQTTRARAGLKANRRPAGWGTNKEQAA